MKEEAKACKEETKLLKKELEAREKVNIILSADKDKSYPSIKIYPSILENCLKGVSFSFVH